jgi:hypothetical protein
MATKTGGQARSCVRRMGVLAVAGTATIGLRLARVVVAWMAVRRMVLAA